MHERLETLADVSAGLARDILRDVMTRMEATPRGMAGELEQHMKVRAASRDAR